jgi:hypothetical protein
VNLDHVTNVYQKKEHVEQGRILHYHLNSLGQRTHLIQWHWSQKKGRTDNSLGDFGIIFLSMKSQAAHYAMVLDLA